MAEEFRISGLNNINFDECATVGHYCIDENAAARGLSKPLAREEVVRRIKELPLMARGHALNRGMSIVEIPCTIRGADTAEMEANEHNLTETLEDAALFIGSHGQRGTRAVLQTKTDDAVESSYKTIYWGKIDEGQARALLSGRIKQHMLMNCILTLYCEPYWRPNVAVTLGPNQIYCPSFEEDGDANGRADDWDARAASVLSMEATIVLHGRYSQQIDTNAANEGIESTAFTAPAGTTEAVAYAWVCRPAAGTDIRVIMRDTSAPADRDTALLSTGGWESAEDASGQTWYKLVVSSNAIVAANNHELWIESTAATVTTFYVDKCFWLWGATVEPDEWCDHWLIYNHYDTTEGAAHEGHINYFDVDDLKGDIEPRLLMSVHFDVAADHNRARHLLVGRRTFGNPGSFLHWYEAEDSSAQVNWADLPLARCSAGECVTNNANVTGYISRVAAAGLVNEIFGEFDVFAAVYTDDYENTWYRLSYGYQANVFITNPWKKQTVNSKWQLIHLGVIDNAQLYRPGRTFDRFEIRIEYEKDAADLARLDCYFCIPRKESAMKLEALPMDVALGYINTSAKYWTLWETGDFDYHAFDSATRWLESLRLLGEPLNLMPRRENRILFTCITNDGTDDIWEAHGAATDLQLHVSNVEYLAQYITPLE